MHRYKLQTLSQIGRRVTAQIQQISNYLRYSGPKTSISSKEASIITSRRHPRKRTLRKIYNKMRLPTKMKKSSKRCRRLTPTADLSPLSLSSKKSFRLRSQKRWQFLINFLQQLFHHRHKRFLRQTYKVPRTVNHSSLIITTKIFRRLKLHRPRLTSIN